ncbi:Spy/CpxP family protein refolding chaperone [Methylocaldum sp. 14B]|jgi:Spy/CpxP family protein refolding chaperone|uniref:Spy/CpxP family protein refolding chaperone n=1 Tax=Methylocaldum sp. 14B TaxID=1912213 RepID=UPI00143B2930|nr:Spy/CpxP family protein refolding chaperone [Methylocaldum sp. 14B]
MKKLSALLTASVFALTAWGLPAAAKTPATESQPRAMDSAHGVKLRKLLESLQEGGLRAHESYENVMLRHVNELKLSDEQIGKIVRIHQDNQQKIKEIGKKLRETQRSAYRLFLNPASDEAAIRIAAKNHSAAFDALVNTALSSRAAINAVLTPEQLNQLKSLGAEP